MSRALNLDFARAGHRAGAWAWLLLAAGLVALALAGLAYRQALADNEQAGARLAQVKRAPARAAPRPLRPDAAETARRQAEAGAQRQMAAPWSELMARLQQGRPADIALLSLDADSRRGDFQIVGLAKDHAAMLGYLRRLQDTPGLRQVALTRHGADQADGVAVVQFTLRGNWGGA